VEKITPPLTRFSRSERIDRAGPIAGIRPTTLFRVISFLLFVVLIRTSVLAQQPHPSESQVKAVYLYNFGKFVRWPREHAANPGLFEICVLGKDPFGPILDSTVTGESVEGKKITVSRPSRIQEASQCNILFISSSEEGRLASILAVAQRYGALTVSDIPHFAERGGMVGFVVVQGRIRFEVNLRASEQSRITLGSELLKVASAVIDKTSGGGMP
jgi:hypothetical protein